MEPTKFFNILVLALSTLSLTTCWRFDRRPKVLGAKLSSKVLNPKYRHVERKIVFYHNMLRSNVSPRAGNMLLMRWHKGASSGAQRWAEECKFLSHDTSRGRWLPRFGACGQNIFISTQQVPWFFAIKTWYLERLNFTYGSGSNSLHDVGHYTQMVWATTHRLGCGFAKCSSYYSYVCNYCPIGNAGEKLGTPYRRGEPCRECPGECLKGKLCTNSCPQADQWANCRDLHQSWPNWLCSNTTAQGRLRSYNCWQTCYCTDKIS